MTVAAATIYAGPVKVYAEGPGGEKNRVLDVTLGQKSWSFHWYEIFPAVRLWVNGEQVAVHLQADCDDPRRSKVRAEIRDRLGYIEIKSLPVEIVVGEMRIVVSEDPSLAAVPDPVVEELQGLIDRGIL